MTSKPRVFIASSLPAIMGDGPATVLRTLLKEQLRDAADVEPWTRQFDLGLSFIESLEIAARDFDFAVIVATGDDPLKKNDKEGLAPRDNVIFELGLFMGAFGRNRCLVVQEDNPKLQLPTDLLGVEAAKFTPSSDPASLQGALDFPALRITKRIRELGVRQRVDPEVASGRESARAFAKRLEGAWWQRVFRDEEPTTSALAFFTVAHDPLASSVTLEGHSYALNGDPAADWNSEVVGLQNAKRRLLYAWSGRALTADLLNHTFNGSGQIDFDPPIALDAGIQRGNGTFWNVDESQPDRTSIKRTEVRRVTDSDVVTTMTGGSSKEKQALVMDTIARW